MLKSAYCNSRTVLIIMMLLLAGKGQAQHYYFPLNNEYMTRYDSSLYRVGSTVHTSVKPFISNEVEAVTSIDTIDAFKIKDKKFNNSLVGRKLFRDHLVQVPAEDFFLYGDFNFEFSGGKSMETVEDKNCFINSRGFSLGGTFGKRFSFYTSFVESQSTFSTYIDSAVRRTLVVPGASRIKNYGDKFDYGTAFGSIAYSLKKYFSFQFGHDKNFIGDGYRSMLLSDNSYNYPFLKINANFWKIKYMVLYTMFQDGPYAHNNDDQSFRRKYATFHYLDVNIGKHLTFGILESIIFKYDSTRGYDLNYLNPVIFLRPTEFAEGSPDNVLMGFNLRCKLNSRAYVYGQLMLDEFKLDEVKAGNGWWGNKQAFQLGFRTFSIFGLKNLDVQGEYNYARPYTYQHKAPTSAYSHYNEPLAHPLGGNFWEAIGSLNYSWKRWNVMARGIYAKVGYDYDSTGTPANYGHNVLLSYDDKVSDYGNETLQGLETTVINGEFRVWYLLNPKSNMVIETGARLRQSENRYGTDNTMYIYFGIRTNLVNRYFDF